MNVCLSPDTAPYRVVNVVLRAALAVAAAIQSPIPMNLKTSLHRGAMALDREERCARVLIFMAMYSISNKKYPPVDASLVTGRGLVRVEQLSGRSKESR